MKIKLTVLIFLLSTNFLIGQTDFRPGYIITNQFDTIPGLLDYRGDIRNCKICIFKSNKNSETIEYLPGDIYSYRFENSKYYISKEIMLDSVHTMVFIEYIVDGIIDLYYYADNNNTYYLIEQENGELAKLNEELKSNIKIENQKGNYVFNYKRYIGVLKVAFKDYPELMPEIEEAKLSHKSLTSITKKYHDYVCNGEECIIYEKEVPFTIRISPVLGIGRSMLSFTEDSFYSNFELSESNFPSIGISINTRIPGFNEKISLQFEAMFNQNEYSGTYNIENELKQEYYDFSIHTKSIQPSLAFKYSFPKGKIRPTLAIGAITNFSVSVDPKLETEKIYTSGVFTSETYDSPFAKSMLGGCIQLGFDYWLKRKHVMFCNLKYSFLGGKTDEVKTNLNQFSLNIGYYLTGTSRN